MGVESIPSAVQRLYAIVGELEQAFATTHEALVRDEGEPGGFERYEEIGSSQ